MALYTFVMEFKGGTYCSQVRATSPRAAAKKWAVNLDTRQIVGLGKTARAELLRDMAQDSLVPLDGLEGVWCCTSRLQGQLALINFVKTVGR